VLVANHYEGKNSGLLGGEIKNTDLSVHSESGMTQATT